MSDPVLVPGASIDAQMAFLNAVTQQGDALPYQAVQKDDNNDLWTDVYAPNHSWECRDYTIYKAELLRAGGWPLSNMFAVLCWVEPEPPAPGQAPKREYHAVQGAKLSNGLIWILDNRIVPSRVYRWDHPVYDYLWAHQQIAGTLAWRDARTGLV